MSSIYIFKYFNKWFILLGGTISVIMDIDDRISIIIGLVDALWIKLIVFLKFDFIIVAYKKETVKHFYFWEQKRDIFLGYLDNKQIIIISQV
jgi:hypothetical protein